MIEFVENNPVNESFFHKKEITTRINVESKPISLNEHGDWNTISSYIFNILEYGDKGFKNRLKEILLKNLDNFTNEEYITCLKKRYNDILFTAFDTSKQVEIIENSDLNSANNASNSFTLFYNKLAYNKEFDKEVYTALFKKFNSHEKIAHSTARTFVSKFRYLTDFVELVRDNITHEEAKQEMIEYYNLINQTDEVMDKYIEEIGLAENILETVYANNDEIFQDVSPIYKSLWKAGISVAFLNEFDYCDETHDELFLKFVKSTKGKLSGVKVWQEFEFDKSHGSREIRMLVTYKDKCYILFPEYIQDKYDETNILNLVHVLLKEEDVKEEFVAVEVIEHFSSYIFGEREKVEKLKKDYRLDYTYEEEGY